MLHVDDYDTERKKLIADKGQGCLDGNAMKWNQLLRSGATNYDQYDTLGGQPYPTVEAMLQFCKANNLQKMWHTLLWAKPEFFPINKNYPITNQAARTTANNDHITTLLTHFRGRFDLVQVWNELLLANGSIKTYPGVDDITNTEIQSNFEAARAADPSAKFGMNDYSIEYQENKLAGYVTLIEWLQNNGTPVDFMGFQCHLKMEQEYSEEEFYSSFMTMIDLGVEVHITELDLAVAAYTGTDVAKRARQSEVLRWITNACVRAGVKSIWWWGLDNSRSWLYEDGTPYPIEAPLPFSPTLERTQMWETFTANLTGSNRKI
jgi:endo-1,4-beta-xylanase